MKHSATNQIGAASSVQITGLSRSGKTTLAAFLDAHPQVAVPFAGTNMWHHFAFRYGPLSERENLEACLDAMMSYDRITWLEPDRKSIEREFALGEASYGRLFALFMSQYAAKRSKPIWGTQSAWLDKYVDDVFATDPRTRVIHILRDPRDRYAEVKAHWPMGRGEAGAATAKWNLAVKMAARNKDRYPERYQLIRFEDLVADPSQVLARVCRLIGIEFDGSMLKAVKRNRSDILRGAEKPPLVDVLSPAALSTPQRELDSCEIRFIQSMTVRGRNMHEYETVPLDLSPVEKLKQFLTYWPGQAMRYVAATFLEQRSRRMPGRFGVPVDPAYLTDHVES